jgi:beta-glucosidase
MANAKHFVDNSQEIGRQGITEVVDERSQWELYYPPFLGAVEAGVLSVMCSYNRVQLSGQQSEGIFSCDNPLSLQHLKQGMNFTGFVISDWYATPPPRLPMSSLKAGLDIEMPGSKCNWLLQHITPAGFALPGGQPAACTHMSPEKISDALDRGDITRADVDDSVTRILNALFAIGEMDEPNLNTPGVVATAAHHATAAEIAAAGTVLLKNQDTKGQPLLPIPLPAPHSGDFTGHAGGGEVLSIAVIGHEALGKTVGGGGSGAVTPSNLTSPINGIRQRVGLSEVEDARQLQVECTVDGRSCVRFQDITQPADVDKALALAARSTHVLVFVATSSQEGMDRDNLTLTNQVCHNNGTLKFKFCPPLL